MRKRIPWVLLLLLLTVAALSACEVEKDIEKAFKATKKSFEDSFPELQIRSLTYDEQEQDLGETSEARILIDAKASESDGQIKIYRCTLTRSRRKDPWKARVWQNMPEN